MKTIDGHTLQAGQEVTLFLECGNSVSGGVHHYGGDNWQVGLHGPYVDRLYYSRLNALRAYRNKLQTWLAEIDAKIKDETQDTTI